MSWVDTKYIGLMATRLDRYKQTGPTTHIFRCPYCGDSQKHTHKTRGYFYHIKDDVRFKCHNCGESRSLRDFIKDICPDLYRGYLFDFFGPSTQAAKPLSEEKVPDAFKVSSKGMTLRFKKKEGFLSNFKPVAVLKPSNPGRAYVEKRMLPEKFWQSIYYVEDANDVFSRIDAYKHKEWKGQHDAIMVPFYSREEDGFTTMFVQLRFLGDDPPIRYLTLELEGDIKAWGLERVDPAKRVYILEGAFDAMFVENAVACAGADVGQLESYLRSIGCEDIVAVWDSDFAVNPDVRAKLENAVNNGMAVALIGPGLDGKDINEAVQKGMNPTSVMAYLDSRVFKGLDAQLELARYKPPNSRNRFNAASQKKKAKPFPSF